MAELFPGQKEKILETYGEMKPWYEYIVNEKTGKTSKKLIPSVLRDQILLDLHIKYFNSLWFMYKDGCYKSVANEVIRNFICQYLDDDVTVKQVKEVQEQLSWYIPSDAMDFNNNDNIINLKNGIIEVNLDTGDIFFKEHSPEIISTIQYKVEYSPKEKPSLWLKFLNDVLPDDQQILLQEIMGYFLLPHTLAKKFYIFFGKKDCGKSVVLDTLMNMLGSENCSAVSLQQLSDPRLPFISSDLFGKIANICGELPSSPVQNTDLIKKATGTDIIRGEKKGKDSFTFYFKGKMLFSCNEIPKSYNDRTDAWFERLLILPFNNSIPENKQDKHLRHKLEAEWEGILNWMIEGLQRFIKNKFVFSLSQSNEKEKEQYKIDSNKPLKFMKDEGYVFDSDAIMSTENLYTNFKQYLQDTGSQSISLDKFLAEIKKIAENENTTVLKTKKRLNGSKNPISCIVGIREKTEAEWEEEENGQNCTNVIPLKPKTHIIL